MKQLQAEIKEFIQEINWQKFHSPKNLAMALKVEATELLEIYQWLSQAESKNLSKETLLHVEQEIGDVISTSQPLPQPMAPIPSTPPASN